MKILPQLADLALEGGLFISAISTFSPLNAPRVRGADHHGHVVRLNTAWSRVRVRCAIAIPIAIAVSGLAGCSTFDETVSNVFSSNADASAVFAGRVLLGKANFTDAHAATIRLQSGETPSLGCLGTLRFTATRGGVVSFTCSDGLTVSIPFQSLSPLRGSGRSQIGNAVFALAYGLPPDAAAAYLAVPVERLARPKEDANTNTKTTAE